MHMLPDLSALYEHDIEVIGLADDGNYYVEFHAEDSGHIGVAHVHYLPFGVDSGQYALKYCSWVEAKASIDAYYASIAKEKSL